MPTNDRAKDRLIVALDVPTPAEAIALVERIGDAVSFYKVGLQLFATGESKAVLEELQARGKNVFFDLKLPDDIGNTIRSTVEVCVSIPAVRFLTVSAQASAATIEAARAGRGDREYPKLLTVPFLSSMGQAELERLYGHTDLEAFIRERAAAAIDAGCDGLIASGDAIRQLRAIYPDRPIVSPGIRPAGSGTDDHARSTTPGEAIAAGADYLVVGRPVTRSEDPRATAEAVSAEIAAAESAPAP